MIVITWQKPERKLPEGPRLSPAHYGEMIAVRTRGLSAHIRQTAIANMVDLGVPDIVLAEQPDKNDEQRRVAISGIGQLNTSTVAKLYSMRLIRQQDAERIMDQGVCLADWAYNVSVRGGLSPATARHASEFCNALKSALRLDGHPAINDVRLGIASELGKDLAAKGPVHAAVASFIADMLVTTENASDFSLAPHYVKDSERPAGLRSACIDASHPGVSLAARDEAYGLTPMTVRPPAMKLPSLAP